MRYCEGREKRSLGQKWLFRKKGHGPQMGKQSGSQWRGDGMGIQRVGGLVPKDEGSIRERIGS